MEEIAKKAEKYFDKNPELPILYGMIYYDQGRAFKENKKFKKALELQDKALLFGSHWAFYNERATIYHFFLKEYDVALDNINRSIELRPVISESYLLRSRIFFAKEDYFNSISDLQTAERLKPGHSETQKWREWAAGNLLHQGHELLKTEPRQAIEDYNLSVEFDDNNFETYHWRGVAFGRLKDEVSALSDFETAIRLNPHHFDSYHMIDYIYAKDEEWDTIIRYWDQYIDLEPDDAEAYFERAGTHYHNQDLESAIDDLKTSCELGNENACQKYNQMKNK
jgi:tetratricopeptide (TPR) repeat protein